MKKLLLIMAMSAILIPTYGQETPESPSKKITDYRLGSWRDNWFISAGAGVNFLFADDNRSGDIFKQLTPAANFSIGKWLTPIWGVRAQYNGVYLRGYHNAPSVFNDGFDSSEGMYKTKMNYINVHGDLMMSLTNWILGYKPDRVYEFIPFAGVGWTQSSLHGYETNQVGFTGGILNRFRISKHWDINLEATAVVVKDFFNDVNYGNSVDVPVSLTAGFTYRFGAPKHQGFKPAGMTDEEKARMMALQRDLDDSRAANDNLRKENADLRNRPAPEPQYVVTEVAKESTPTETVLFFEHNKANLTKEDKLTLRYVAEQIKNTPDAKFTITGYADPTTGTAEYNQTLSEKRAKAVYDQLVKEGISEDQLTMEGKGGFEKFKDDKSLNRVVFVKNK